MPVWWNWSEAVRGEVRELVRRLRDCGTRADPLNKLPPAMDLYVELIMGDLDGDRGQGFTNRSIDPFGRKLDGYDDFLAVNKSTGNHDWRPQIYKEGNGALWCPHYEPTIPFTARENHSRAPSSPIMSACS